MSKLSALPEDTLPTSDDFTVSVDATSNTTKRVKWSNIGNMMSGLIKPFIYPVGAVFIETTGTNPATSMGFGTWVAYAQGAALVGISGSGTFALTAGTVIGEENHTLSWGEMPNHNHGINDPGHSHSGNSDVVNTAGGGNNRVYNGGGSGQQLQWSNYSIQASGTGISTQAAGSGAAHNNIQPSIAVYIWRRTA